MNCAPASLAGRRLMNWLFVVFGLLLSLAGAWSVYQGADINQRGQDWAQLVAGAVLVSGGAVTLALSMLMFKLDGLRKAFKKAAAATPEIPKSVAVPHPPIHAPVPAPMPVAAPAEPEAMTAEPPVLPKAALVAGMVAAAAGTAAMLATRRQVQPLPVPPIRPLEAVVPPLPPETLAALPDEPEMPRDLPPVPELHVPAVPHLEPPPVPGSAHPGVAAETHILSDTAEAELSVMFAPPPHHIPAAEAGGSLAGSLEGNWLDQALSGDPSDPMTFNPQPVPAPALPEPQALARPEPEPLVGKEDALENEVAREMSFARPASDSKPQPGPVPEWHEEPAPMPVPIAIIGRHKVGNVEYVMYADGSIEADDGGSRQRFASMDELKAHLVQPA